MHDDMRVETFAVAPGILVAELRDADGVVARTSVAADRWSHRRGLEKLAPRIEVMIARALATPSARLAELDAPRIHIPNVRPFAWLQQKIEYRFQRDRWSIGIAFGDGPFRAITPPRNRMWADPFVIAERDRAWIFVEELVYPIKRGFISVIEARRDGTWSAPRRVLERPYHLSYPCVFRWQGVFFMVPESQANRTIELYRCKEFPWRWELDTILMKDLRAVDSTIFEHEGRWWMYTAIPDSDTSKEFDTLLAFHAPSPRGPWTPHARNPLETNVAGGRPAGRPFMRNGTLVRATQIGAPWYGHAMQLREIVTLTPDAWDERVVEIIRPDWRRGLIGAHTLNADGDVRVIDGLQRQWGRRGRSLALGPDVR
jgi:hypothetical protein